MLCVRNALSRYYCVTRSRQSQAPDVSSTPSTCDDLVQKKEGLHPALKSVTHFRTVSCRQSCYIGCEVNITCVFLFSGYKCVLAHGDACIFAIMR